MQYFDEGSQEEVAPVAAWVQSGTAICLAEVRGLLRVSMPIQGEQVGAPAAIAAVAGDTAAPVKESDRGANTNCLSDSAKGEVDL